MKRNMCVFVNTELGVVKSVWSEGERDKEREIEKDNYFPYDHISCEPQ